MGRGGDFALKLMLEGGAIAPDSIARAGDMAALRALYAHEAYYPRLAARAGQL